MKKGTTVQQTEFAHNLKFLRIRKEKSQTAMAEELGLKRTSLIGYEKGVQPPFAITLQMADYFKVSVDALLRYNLSKLGKFELSQIEQGFDVDITGNKLRLLVTTTDQKGKENIEMVKHQAQAGYTQGYNDPEYIESLPKFQLPFLSRNKTYRCFQIKGDSMPPLSDGSWVTASFVQDWNTIKNGTSCVVITKEDGIVFKLIYNQIKENQEIMLVSSNRAYTPYSVPIDELAEVWKFETYNAFEV